MILEEDIIYLRDENAALSEQLTAALVLITEVVKAESAQETQLRRWVKL